MYSFLIVLILLLLFQFKAEEIQIDIDKNPQPSIKSNQAEIKINIKFLSIKDNFLEVKTIPTVTDNFASFLVYESIKNKLISLPNVYNSTYLSHIPKFMLLHNTPIYLTIKCQSKCDFTLMCVFINKIQLYKDYQYSFFSIDTTYSYDIDSFFFEKEENSKDKLIVSFTSGSKNDVYLKYNHKDYIKRFDFYSGSIFLIIE